MGRRKTKVTKIDHQRVLKLLCSEVYEDYLMGREVISTMNTVEMWRVFYADYDPKMGGRYLFNYRKYLQPENR